MANRRFSISGRLLFILLRVLNKEPIKFFVADIEGKPVGTTMVETRGKIGYIQAVSVHQDHRQKGIATQLMNSAIDYLKTRKLNKAVLHVLSKNQPAKNLYQKLGFKKFEDIQCLSASIDSLPNVEKPESIELRDFARSDIDSVYDLIRISREPERLRVYDFKKTDLRTSRWQRIARIGAAKRTVAVRDNRIVGYATTNFTTSKIAGRVTNIEVHLEMLSERIEEQLIRNGADYLKTRGAQTVLVMMPTTRETTIGRLTSLGFKKSYVMEGMVLESL